jgi:K+-transporting ATPase A subunit
MATVYGRFRSPGLLGVAERGFCRLVRADPGAEQDWRGYGLTVLVFSAVCTGLLYLILRAQGHLPLNPDT